MAATQGAGGTGQGTDGAQIVNCRILVVLLPFVAMAQPTVMSNRPVLSGPEAPDPLVCRVETAGTIYSRVQDPANGPTGVYVCTQTNKLSYAWVSAATDATGNLSVASSATIGGTVLPLGAVDVR